MLCGYAKRVNVCVGVLIVSFFVENIADVSVLCIPVNQATSVWLRCYNVPFRLWLAVPLGVLLTHAEHVPGHVGCVGICKM